jgi:hypothetical protein
MRIKAAATDALRQYAVSANKFLRLVFGLIAPQYVHLGVSRSIPINIPIRLNNIVSAK